MIKNTWHRAIGDTLKAFFTRKGNIHIGNVIHGWTPIEVKPNEWGGLNKKYTVMPGQHVLTLSEENNRSYEWDEITYLSVHDNIPAFSVEIDQEYEIICSPKNSILVKDGSKYRTVNLIKEDVIGLYTPCISNNGGIENRMITDCHYMGTQMRMYDVSLKKNKIFLADNYLFVMDTIGVHVPVSNEAVREAERMMPSRHLYDDVASKITSFPDHSAALGIYILSKAPEGRKAINKYLPKHRHIKGALNKPALKDLLGEMAKEDSRATAIVVDNLIRLGDGHSYETGFSLGLSDLAPLTDLRERVMADIKKDILYSKDKSPAALKDIYKRHVERASSDIDEHFKGIDSPMSDVVLSKARGSASQLRDILLSPIAVNAADAISKPIAHSYIEGLKPSEHFAGAAGGRAGTISKSQGTAEPGALGNLLFANTNMLVINKERGSSMGVIRLPLSDPTELMDRYIGEDVIVSGKKIIAKDSLVEPRTVQIARKHGLKDLPVYTPLGSSSADGGIPAMSYGLMRGNTLPEVGYNIGAHAASGIVAPLYTESMGSFHSGGSLQDKDSGYPRLKQVLELTKSISNKATLATTSGIVESIEKDSLGGHNVLVDGVSHYVSPSNNLIVSAGSSVDRGDPLSNGPIDPRDLAINKNMAAAQSYMVDELVKNTPGHIRRRAAEVVVEGITRYGEITDPGESEYQPGDIKLVSDIEKRNKDQDQGIKYEPVFRGINSLPLYTQNWMSQVNFRNIKKNLSNSVTIGAKADTEAYEPSAGLALGINFGQGKDGKY
ncbi:MAG: hypothetical protein PHX79_06365 [Sphaerochaetaceae bacterium]|nr:hypothetical protein [Sphaerochaetaceae bacterium]